MNMKTELVIVGGGLAGFAAALTAAEAGLDVILLEKTSETGGSSAMSSGCLAFAGTDLQQSQSIKDSSELLFQDLREVGKLENDEQIVRAYVDNQLATYEWLKGRGVSFSPVIEASSGQSVPRSHNVDPADMVRQLAAAARGTSKVTILMSTAAKRLVRNPSSGRVEAVLAERDGVSFNIASSRGVLLASGGFVHNAELIHRFSPEYDNAIFIGGEGNVGDGLKMAWQLGADFCDMIHIKGTFGKHPVDMTNHHPCLAVYKGAIAVNQEGNRFVDESLSYKLLGDACMLQSYSTTYQILDQDIFQSGDNGVRILDFERRYEEGLFLKADSLVELAELIEVPYDPLAETIAQYNRFVTAECDKEFGRKHLVHNHGELRRIVRGPFYAYPSTAAVFGTYCGLRIDNEMRVIDVFGQRIDGLLAAGEVVGGLHGAAYMTGSSLGKAAIFGRIAATTAASS
jgi:fumarate reductase flavoprotein subunit